MERVAFVFTVSNMTMRPAPERQDETKHTQKSITRPHPNPIHMEKSRGDGIEKERQRRAPYRFLCSRAPCRSEWGWSSPGWRGMSCGLTWCCCGPIIGRRAPATWCRPSQCQDPIPRWPSSRGAACPGHSCTWPRETGGHRRSRGFGGKSLHLQKENKSKCLVTKAASSDQSFLNVWQPYVYSSEQGKACGRINILPPCEVVN